MPNPNPNALLLPLAVSNYFSFQQHTKESQLSSCTRTEQQHGNNDSLHSLISEHDSDHFDTPIITGVESSPVPQLPRTDFASKTVFLVFIGIALYFIIPRVIDTWIEITVQKLSFPVDSASNTTYVAMLITGHLYVSNPNYLPIVLSAVQMDLYFESKNQSNHYLLSYTTTFNEMQNEKAYNIDYPFSVQLDEHVQNDTLQA
eukprot:CAMPEP_0202729060 /NCGR_PEP_ID=MMETSP1385-20130828/185942_1 /ASSEMBLY_ACC=CAM_ASM_000861 /TAXON_ID=933848 /ORGANISM="Elphidium margaritaceum" /LENGTH=201 /DNA_ID=CAMNT_0049395317 /DNA_START=59 /DNA_END=659 /DNA_ORIENTATION=-